MSGQQCENYDVKRETVHCRPRNVDRCCSWSLESGAQFSNFAFVLFCYITNHLMTGPLKNSEFCFPRISMFPSTSSRETLRFSGNKIHCCPQDQSLSVKCHTQIPAPSLASTLSKVCIRAKWPIRPELIPVSVAWSDWEYFYSPLGWDASPSQGYPQH